MRFAPLSCVFYHFVERFVAFVLVFYWLWTKIGFLLFGVCGP